MSSSEALFSQSERPIIDFVSHENISIKGLFLMIGTALSASPSNTRLSIAVLQDLALKNDPGWQQRTFGFLNGVWALGGIDGKTLERLESSLYRYNS